jgi:uncharacterized protein YdgA (DUF945 family)
VRRSIFFIAIIVLGIVLGAPFVVGRLAQARQAQVLEGISENIVGARVLTEDYRAGWLTSTARHRIIFGDRPIGAAVRDLSPNNEADPSLVIETRLAHGPWPALNGSPGFARLRSTLRYESSKEQGFDIPGEILTVVEFNGDGRSTFSAQAMDEIVTDWPGFIRWDGGLFTVDFDGRGEVIRYSGDIGRLQLSVGDAEIVLGVLQVSGEANHTGFGFREGDNHLSLDSLRAAQHGSRGFDAQNIELVTRMETADRLVNQSVRLDIGRFESPLLTDANLHLEASTERLDAPALGRLIRKSQEQRTTNHGDDLQDLLQAGPELHVENLRLQSAQGDVFARLDVTLPSLEDAPSTNPADILKAISGQANVSISPGILSLATGNIGQGADLASTLVTMGYLRPQDGNYVADVFFKGGLMTINGLPMIMPMGR